MNGGNSRYPSKLERWANIIITIVTMKDHMRWTLTDWTGKLNLSPLYLMSHIHRHLFKQRCNRHKFLLYISLNVLQLHYVRHSITWSHSNLFDTLHNLYIIFRRVYLVVKLTIMYLSLTCHLQRVPSPDLILLCNFSSLHLIRFDLHWLTSMTREEWNARKNLFCVSKSFSPFSH